MPHHDMQQQTLRMRNDAFFAEVKRCIAEGKNVVIMVTGNSMEPFLESYKHELRLRGCAQGEPRRGDVVAALTRGGDYVIHRVVGFGVNDKVILCGDGNIDGRNECTSRNNIVGIVTHYRRLGTKDFQSLKATSWRLRSYLWPQPGRIRRILLVIHRRVYLSMLWKLCKPDWMKECYKIR